MIHFEDISESDDIVEDILPISCIFTSLINFDTIYFFFEF